MSFKEPFDYYAKEKYLTATRQGGLTLYNYTSKCALERNWNYHTMSARGLVLDDAGGVIARPFPKFFNLNERPETRADILPAETPELSDKMDGSLVVVFYNPETDHWQAVTRGSWNNAQTRYANEWLKRGYHLSPQYTYLFELVAPWNRVVIHYPESRMVLVGLIHTESSEDMSYSKIQQVGLSLGLDPVHFEVRPFQEIDFDDPRVVSEEGYVARYSSGLRVKIKYQQYVRLHRILTVFSPKNIWEDLCAGRETDLSCVPAEFMAWFNKEKSTILAGKKSIEDKARAAFGKTPKCSSRREYAEYFNGLSQPLPAMCFRMLDGKSFESLAWKWAKPRIHKTFQKEEEP